MERLTSRDGSLTLRSERYGESYRSGLGARSESWHVFVAGSGVAARLAAGAPTRVLEIGLGSARNLAASARVALAHGTPLRYVALEHDLLPADVWADLDDDALGPAPFRRALLAARAGWSGRPGERARLDHGVLSLEVVSGDACVAPLPSDVHAVYLDGFSPAVNPELWSETFLARLSACLAPGGTLVSYSVRGAVRRALTAAGLRVEKRAGPPGGKRERLWAQRPEQAHADAGPAAPASVRGRAGRARRRLALIGGGVAGASLALAAARAGLDVTLFSDERSAAAASAVPAALINPYRGRSGRASDDDLAGAARTWAWAAQLEGAGLESGAHASGVVRLADAARQARAWSERAGAQAFGPEPEPAPGRWRAPDGGMLIPVGGWIDPPRWLAALRAAAERLGARWHQGCRVVALQRDDEGLRLTLHGPSEPAADALARGPFDLVAVCIGAFAPAALPHLPVTPVPGGVALVAAHMPSVPLAGAVYAAPVGSPSRYGLDPRQAWLAIGGGHGADGTDGDPSALATVLARSYPGALPLAAQVWRGVRARGPDPQPQQLELTPGVWWFGSFAGRGFLRAALEAERLVARWS